MSNYFQILFVDDDKDDRLIMLEYFQQAQLDDKIYFLENGQKTMSYLESIVDDKYLPNLVVLDLNMPILSGVETLQRMKRSDRFKNIPVIIFSTLENESEKRKCLNFGAIDYIVKPMTYAQGESIARKFCSFVK